LSDESFTTCCVTYECEIEIKTNVFILDVYLYITQLQMEVCSMVSKICLKLTLYIAEINLRHQ